MNTKTIICEKLNAAFDPTDLEVTDQSEAHRGHAHFREGVQTHFKIMIRSAVFNDLTRIDRQRLVYKTLAVELAGDVHALALDVQGV